MVTIVFTVYTVVTTLTIKCHNIKLSNKLNFCSQGHVAHTSTIFGDVLRQTRASGKTKRLIVMYVCS